MYFEILEDTLIGRFLPAFVKRPRRRAVQSPKFYFFDVGIAAGLARRGEAAPGSELFGRAFEHLIFQEIAAHSRYSGAGYPMAYWRTSSGIEADFVLGDHEIVLEVKASSMARRDHAKGLRWFREEYETRSAILISLDPEPRRTEDGMLILPWRVFLERLWAGEILR